MAMMPKRVKFRKSQRGRIRGNACRGNTVAYGDFGFIRCGSFLRGKNNLFFKRVYFDVIRRGSSRTART